MTVLDASAAVEWLLARDGAAAVADRFRDPDVIVHPPSLAAHGDLRNKLTPYDAVYVALAEVLDATLATTDARIARAPGLRTEIDVVAAE